MTKQTTARRSQSALSIERALTLHREGRLDEADRLYGGVLAADPRHFDALHLSGVLRQQQGRLAEALRLVAAALEAKPGAADARVNYGAILPWWDMLFRTADFSHDYVPTGDPSAEEVLATGSYAAQQVAGLRRLLRTITGRAASVANKTSGTISARPQ